MQNDLQELRSFAVQDSDVTYSFPGREQYTQNGVNQNDIKSTSTSFDTEIHTSFRRKSFTSTLPYRSPFRAMRAPECAPFFAETFFRLLRLLSRESIPAAGAGAALA